MHLNNKNWLMAPHTFKEHMRYLTELIFYTKQYIFITQNVTYWSHRYAILKCF